MKNKGLYLLLTIGAIVILLFNNNVFSQHDEHEHQNTTEQAEVTHQNETHPAIVDDHTENGHNDAHSGEGHEGGGHHSDMGPLLFIIIALLIGTSTRHLFSKIPIPYTVTLLLYGILLGFLSTNGYLENWLLTETDIKHFAGQSIIQRGVNWAGNIDPHMVLYIFLPVLIFEAAFAMDTHTFKKIFANASILAIPGIIVALVLTAAFMIALKSFGFGEHLGTWGWPVALLFGTVISATDPVAVVALLKELGASKKLGTLIEGESLLNDGTAIVIYLVLIGTVTGTANPDAGVLAPLWTFLIVSLGGTALGLFTGWLTISWIKRVFNDALVEIIVIVAAAFITFFIAEYFLHVSGVLALVALGLVMAGIGRTRISPEVEHFLHEFWELAAFIANTLIFIIVGVVIAEQALFSGNVHFQDYIILGLLFAGIHIVRAIVIGIFYPAMKRIGYGLNGKEAKILWYGALRGAIGLALGLMVAGQEGIPQVIKDQFLFYTAGIVMLTLCINATTIGALVNKLGLTKLSPAKAHMLKDANNYLRESSMNAMEKFKKDRYMSKANWKSVEKYLPELPEHLKDIEIEEQTNVAEVRRRILEKEKSSYWAQFKEGLIGPTAVKNLTSDISEILDSGGKVSLSERKDLETEWKTPKLLGSLQSIPLIGSFARKMFFEKLSVSYDSARGFVTAQEEALALVQNMIVGRESGSEISDQDLEKLKQMEQEVNENRIHGLTFIRNLRNTYPEIYKAIATKQAVRSVLNYEKKTLERLQKKGRLDSGETAGLMDSIEIRMKKLMDTPPSFAMPKQDDMLNEIPWLQGIEEKTFEKIAKAFQNKLYSVGDKIVKEDGPGNGLYLIIRGKVRIILRETVIDILGPGSLVGEMGVLTGMPRTATVIAESPVTALYISNKKMLQIMETSKVLSDKLWSFAANRFAENLLRKNEPYSLWVQKEFKHWTEKGKMFDKKERDEIILNDEVGILITGQIERVNEKREVLNGPIVLEKGDIIKSDEAKVYICAKKQK